MLRQRAKLDRLILPWEAVQAVPAVVWPSRAVLHQMLRAVVAVCHLLLVRVAVLVVTSSLLLVPALRVKVVHCNLIVVAVQLRRAAPSLSALLTAHPVRRAMCQFQAALPRAVTPERCRSLLARRRQAAVAMFQCPLDRVQRSVAQTWRYLPVPLPTLLALEVAY